MYGGNATYSEHEGAEQRAPALAEPSPWLLGGWPGGHRRQMAELVVSVSSDLKLAPFFVVERGTRTRRRNDRFYCTLVSEHPVFAGVLEELAFYGVVAFCSVYSPYCFTVLPKFAP